MRVLALVALMILAGCADAPEPAADDEVQLDEDLEATETTGILRGVVVDTAIVPIEGASVTGPGLETTTNEGGAFGFGDLQPGNYCLDFTRIGYEPVRSCSDVVAGEAEPPIVRVQMIEDPGSLPSVAEFKFNGMVRCGLSYIALCGAGGDNVGDSFMYTQELNGMPDFITMEAIWEGSQPTGDNFQLRLGHTPASPDTVDATATGPSPQQAFVNRTIIEQSSIGGGNDLVGRMFVWEMEGTNIEDHTGQCVPVVLTTWCHGPGAAIDQSFELFTHAFYGYTPPEGWRFTDSDVPAPPS